MAYFTDQIRMMSVSRMLIIRQLEPSHMKRWSNHGKGLCRAALYLTRWIIDASQDFMVNLILCGQNGL